MSAFVLVPPTDAAGSRAASLSRTLYVPDLEGNWRELRLGDRPHPTTSAPRPPRDESFLIPRAA